MKRLFLIFLPVLSLLYWYFFLRFVPLPPLQISRETTYFTDVEKLPDGKVSLANSINRQFAVKPEENAAIEMLQIYGLHKVSTDSAKIDAICKILEVDKSLFAEPALAMPDNDTSDGQEFSMSDKVNNFHQIIWHEDDNPEFAAFMRSNERTLALLESMARKKAFFWPLLSSESVWNSLPPQGFRPFQLARMMLARSMNHMAGSRVEDAWNDISNSFQIGKVIATEKSVIFSLYGMLIIKDAFFSATELLNHKDLSEPLLNRIIDDLSRIEIASATFNSVAFEQRFFMLSIVLEDLNSLKDMTNMKGDSEKTPSELDQYFDRNLFCRKINQVADELSAVWTIPDLSGRLQGLKKFQEKMRQEMQVEPSGLMFEILWAKYLTPATGKASRISEVIWKILFAMGQPDNILIINEGMAINEIPRLLIAAARLRLQQMQTGRVPDNFQEFAPLEKASLTDSFTNELFKLSIASDSILIYSVGPNQTDDNGKITNNLSEGDLVISIKLQPE